MDQPSERGETTRMKTLLVVGSVLTVVAVLVAVSVARAGMMGSGMGSGEMPMGQAPQTGEDKAGEPPGQMPMRPEFAARMMNACIGAMEGMAQMGRMMGTMGGMMGGQGGTSRPPSKPQQ